MRMTSVGSPAAVLKNAPCSRIFEQLHHLFGEPDGQFQIAQFEAGFVQIEQRLREERVVVQEAGDGGRPGGSAAAGCRCPGRTCGRR
jgi:hypothetical protein